MTSLFSKKTVKFRKLKLKRYDDGNSSLPADAKLARTLGNKDLNIKIPKNLNGKQKMSEKEWIAYSLLDFYNENFNADKVYNDFSKILTLQ